MSIGASPRQFATGAGASAANEALAFPINVRNDTRIFVLAHSLGGDAVSSITDSQGNTYTKRADITPSSFKFEIWDAPSGTAGANTVTVNFAGTDFLYIWIIEVAGLGTIQGYQSNGLDHNAAADPMPLATLTPTSEGVIFTMYVLDGSETFVSFADSTAGNAILDLASPGGSTTRRAMCRTVDDVDALTPEVDFSTTGTGESITFNARTQAAVVAGSGESSSVF